MTREPYYNPNATRYPNRHEVVKTIESWGRDVCPAYSLAGVKANDPTSFQAMFHDPVTGMSFQISLDVYPNQHKSHLGWHVRDHRLWRVSTTLERNYGVEVYEPHLESLMLTFPNARIMHLDNEDDNWPIFGYAALRHDGFIGFIQTPRDEDADEEYWKNDDLPYSTIVTDQAILDRINDDMWAHTMMNIVEGYSGKY